MSHGPRPLVLLDAQPPSSHLGIRSLWFLPLCYQGAWASLPVLIRKRVHNSAPPCLTHRVVSRIETVCMKVVYNHSYLQKWKGAEWKCGPDRDFLNPLIKCSPRCRLSSDSYLALVFLFLYF